MAGSVLGQGLVTSFCLLTQLLSASSGRTAQAAVRELTEHAWIHAHAQLCVHAFV